MRNPKVVIVLVRAFLSSELIGGREGDGASSDGHGEPPSIGIFCIGASQRGHFSTAESTSTPHLEQYGISSSTSLIRFIS